MTSGYHVPVAEHYNRFPYPPYPWFAYGRWRDLKSVDVRRWGGDRPVRDLWIVGCGTIAPLMFGRRNFNVRILATDLSKKSLAACRRRLRLFGIRNIELKCEDLIEAPYEKQFDAVDCYGVIHCTVSPRLALERLVKSLRIGGVLRFMVYSQNSRKEIEKLRHEVIKQKLQSIEDVEKLVNASGIEKTGDLKSKEGMADALLTPIVHVFNEDTLQDMLNSFSRLKVLSINRDRNFVVTAKRIPSP